MSTGTTAGTTNDFVKHQFEDFSWKLVTETTQLNENEQAIKATAPAQNINITLPPVGKAANEDFFIHVIGDGRGTVTILDPDDGLSSFDDVVLIAGEWALFHNAFGVVYLLWATNHEEQQL